jgi:Protoglobin
MVVGSSARYFFVRVNPNHNEKGEPWLRLWMCQLPRFIASKQAAVHEGLFPCLHPYHQSPGSEFEAYMRKVAEEIHGYTYGSSEVARSPVSLQELEDLKTSAGFTAEDERYLRLAGEVLADQTERIVLHWRSGIIASIPNLAKHSRTPEGDALPDYLAKSNLRFQQWILDTCLRTYDQDWLNYQEEIALRHTSSKKNKVDGVQSTPYVPLRDIIAFIAVMNETIRPYLAAKGNPASDVEKMHLAWCKSLQLQLALWTRAYTDSKPGLNEW